MPTTDTAARYRDAIAGAGLPADVTWSVQVSGRRKHLGATIHPGGSVVFAVPASMPPARVAEGVRRMRGRLAVAAHDKRDRGVTIIRKQLVNGEGFPFAGRPQRLRLISDGDDRDDATAAGPLTRHPGVPIISEAGPSTWSGIRTWQLTMRRDAASAATVIEWYRAQGQAWLDQHMPDMLRRLYVRPDELPTWSVRPYRAGDQFGGSWGRYRWPEHTITFHWAVFQFPANLLRYVAAHEAAHAALKGQHAHGRPWQLVVSRLCPDWRELDRPAKTADGLTLWAGELDDTAGYEPPAPVEPVPFVSRWGTLAGAR